MVKTTNKNVDEVLFKQLKCVDFEYLVQLNGLIGDYIDVNGADTLDEEMVTFDITLNAAIKERMNELLNAEKKVKEIIAEDREKDNKVKYVKEAREYLESLEDRLDGKTIDHECLEIIDRLKKNIYDFGTLETQTSVLKTLIETDTYKNEENVERAIIASHLAMWEVIKEVEQEELDKYREYINATSMEENDDEINRIIDDYNLNEDCNFCAWYMCNLLALAHVDELYLVEYIDNRNENLCFVIQDGEDFDLCEPYCFN